MGAWGVGPFENDTAADFLNFLENNSLAQIEPRLTAALNIPADYFVLDAGDEQVAAIAVIAELTQYSRALTPAFNLENLKWMSEVSWDLLEQWREQAILALAKLREDDNELLQLWGESGEKDHWLAELDKLQQLIS